MIINIIIGYILLRISSLPICFRLLSTLGNLTTDFLAKKNYCTK